MQRVLKIGGADEYSIHHFGSVQFVIVVKNLYVTAQLFVYKGFPFFPAAIPDIGQGYHFEVHLFHQSFERRDVRRPETIRKAYTTHSNAVVRAKYPGVALGGNSNRCTSHS